MSAKTVYLLGFVALLAVTAIAFGSVDKVKIELLKGVFALDSTTSLVTAADEIVLSDKRDAPDARTVLLGHIGGLKYEHPVSGGLRELESLGKGPWQYVQRDVKVAVTEDSRLGPHDAAVCGGGEFSGESFVLFATANVDPSFLQFIGTEDTACLDGQNIVRIRSGPYRYLFGGSAAAGQTTQAKRIPLKYMIWQPDGTVTAPNKRLALNSEVKP
jgi:hypothetical protein